MANEYGWAPMPQSNTGYQAPMSGTPAMPDRLEQWRNRTGVQPVQQYPMPYPQTQNVPQGTSVQDPPNGWLGLNWVVSEAEAQMYPVAPGNTAVMLEVDREIAYIKSVSREGRPGFWAYHMVPVKPKQENEYVTREEYNTLLAENNKMLAMIQRLTERSAYEQSTTAAGRKPDEQPNAAEYPAVRPDIYREPEGGGHAPDPVGTDLTGSDQPMYGNSPAA